MLRFLLVFLALQAVLFTAELTPPVQRWLVQLFTGLLADISGLVIAATGRDITTSGVVIQDVATGFGVRIAAGCNGVEAVILLVAAILAFPAPWRHRLVGIVVGIGAIQALNLVRIVSLFWLGLWDQTAFQWAHLYIWQALIMLDALLVWLIWIRRLPRQERRDDLASA